MMYVKLLLLLLVCDYVYGSAPEITTPFGKLEGYYKNTVTGKLYAAFEGIPYAKPPVGKYKFTEPEVAKKWSGTWAAKTLTSCIQYYHYTEPGQDYVRGEEDCLHINVYTPYNKNATNLNVIVFIHGGAFMFNSGGTYGPNIIMDNDIVFVSFNYRLGPIGFLSTEDQHMPGNIGIRDQLLALQWIKNNIIYFGGNSNSITLTGMSAGGVSVHLHTLSPRTQGKQLFHRAIAQSGTALNAWAIAENSREKALRLGSLLGCPTDDTHNMIKCLKYRTSRQIVAAVKYFQPWLYNPFSPFGVVIDSTSKNPILPKHPLEILKTKQVMDIPIIFSNVESEGLYPAAEFVSDEKYLKDIDEKWNEIIPFILDYNNTVLPKDIIEVSQKIRKFYLGDKKVTKTTFPLIVKMITDRLFVADIEKAARIHASSINTSTYFYYFSYKGTNSKADARTKNSENYGTSHGDDTIYVLSTNLNTSSTNNDKDMSKIFQNQWLSFANNSMPILPNIVWSPVSKNINDDLAYAHINSPNDINMKTVKYFGNRMNFWETLHINENQILEKKDEL